jgi:hypothetical protein
MDAVRFIDDSIFCKEPVRSEPLEQLLASVAVEIVNHAAFALKTAADDVEKANFVTFLVTLVLHRWMHLLDITGAFVTKSGLMS